MRSHRRTLPLLACIVLTLAALALAGCTTKASPNAGEGPAAAAPIPIAGLTADERALMASLLDKSGEMPTSIGTIEEARKLFPGILVPSDTGGRKLLGIVERRGTSSSVPDTTEMKTLYLVYQGPTVVAQVYFPGRPSVMMPDATTGIIAIEATRVGSADATSAVLARTGRPERAGVWWTAGSANGYMVSGPGRDKAAVLRVARSMR